MSFVEMQATRGSNEHPEFVLTRRLVELAGQLHADVRAKAGLDENWSGQSESMRAHYLRMAARLDARRAEFFQC